MIAAIIMNACMLSVLWFIAQPDKSTADRAGEGEQLCAIIDAPLHFSEPFVELLKTLLKYTLIND